MVDIKIEVRGLAQLRAFFKDAPKKLEGAIEDSLSALADDIYDTTTGLAPVDTGDLVKSISVSKMKTKISATAGVDYASYVDQGTVNMSAEPFFSEPIKQITDSYNQRLLTKLQSSGLLGR